MSQELEAAQYELKLVICKADTASVVLRTLHATHDRMDLELLVKECSAKAAASNLDSVRAIEHAELEQKDAMVNPTAAELELLNELHLVNIALIGERTEHMETKRNLAELKAAAAADNLCATHGLDAAAAEIAALRTTNAEILAELVRLRDIHTAIQRSFSATAPV